MAALIRGCHHVDTDKLTEDEFVKAWVETKYYLETVNQVSFK